MASQRRIIEMFSIESIVRYAVTLSWPYFVTLLLFGLVAFLANRVKSWPDVWRLVVVVSVFAVLATVMFWVYRRYFRP
jgi:hypothetical protein